MVTLVALCLSACQDTYRFAEVEGVVMLDNMPLASVEVVFLPDPERGTFGPRSACYTDQKGRYRLRCERPEVEGTVIGLHRVCVHDITALPAPIDPVTEEGITLAVLPVANGLGLKASRVPSKYSDVSRTPLRDVSVEQGRQVLDIYLYSSRVPAKPPLMAPAPPIQQ